MPRSRFAARLNQLLFDALQTNVVANPGLKRFRLACAKLHVRYRRLMLQHPLFCLLTIREPEVKYVLYIPMTSHIK